MFTEVSPVLALPFILPSQAQKHVTHNQAIRMLDALVQLSVASRSVSAPPEAAVTGERYLVPATATGDWSGQAGRLAVHQGSGWKYYVPNAGWTSWVEDEAVQVIFDGTDWLDDGDRSLVVAQLGVSATPDDFNRLSVTGGASLFNHAGSGHQIKVNKAAMIDTASLLFQTGFSGRAEMGLAGNDDFSLKVSADGVAWTEAMRVDAATGRPALTSGAVLAPGTAALPALGFVGAAGTGLYLAGAHQLGFAVEGVSRAQLGPAGLTLDVPLTGTAVTQGQTDVIAGRMLKVGDYGWGGLAPAVSTAGALDAVVSNQRVRVLAGTAATVNGPSGAGGGICDSYAFGATSVYQEYREITSPYRLWRRALVGAVWSAWLRAPNMVVGAITASGGEATAGGVIERGANANGEFTRFADGSQICTHVLTGSATAAVSWTYPASFAAVPCLVVTPRTTNFPRMTVGQPFSSTAQFRTFSETGAGSPVDVSLLAVGRWF